MLERDVQSFLFMLYKCAEIPMFNIGKMHLSTFEQKRSNNSTSSHFSLFIIFLNIDNSSLELIANGSQGLSDLKFF